MNSRKEHWIQWQINFDVFFTSSHFQPNKLLPGGPFRPVGGGRGGGCDRTLRTPPPLAYAPGIFVNCGIWCLADVSSVSPSSEQAGELWFEECEDSSIPQSAPTEGLTLETSAKHHIPQATNIPYQPLLIKPIFYEKATAPEMCAILQLVSTPLNPRPLIADRTYKY